MKNIILLALVCLALFSCKKDDQEIKTETKQKHYFYVEEVKKTGETERSNIVVVL